MEPARPQHPAPSGSLSEVVRYFVRLGFIAFGGPAAHIALMRRELVAERGWLTDQEFVDHLGVTNLIPGPNSTEMTMHLGAKRAGWPGLWLGGVSFIIPAVLIVLVLAWAYVEYGDTPAGEALLFGIQPVILAVIIQAIWGLRTAAVKGLATLGVLVAVALLAIVTDLHELVLLLGSGLLLLALHFVTHARTSAGWPERVQDAGASLGALARRLPGWLTGRQGMLIPPWWPGGAAGLATHPALVAAAQPAGYSLWELFLVFVRVGGFLYGSGYVLISFLETELVEARGWLTQEQLVDAIAVGQFTPGPVFSTATFVGYVIDRLPGALVATAGIFLPSFVFVALTHPFVPRLREWRWTAPFLDGVNAAAIALMAVVTYRLARDVLDDGWQTTFFVLSAGALVRFNPNSAWIVLAGALAGLAHRVIT